MTRKADFFGVLQTTSGIYLATFLVSHMTAVFILARLVLNVNTNDAWAAGLPVGLVANLWNTRLIPNYSLAAFLLIAHVGSGFRGILLAHGRFLGSANRITLGITGVGAMVATVIIVAMLGLHVAAHKGVQQSDILSATPPVTILTLYVSAPTTRASADVPRN